MDWKKRYDVLKVGDKIIVIKENPDCDNRCFDCCLTKGKIYKITDITSTSDYGTHTITTNKGGSCSIPPECLQKV